MAVNDADICKIAKTDALNATWDADNDKCYLLRLSNLKKENKSCSQHLYNVVLLFIIHIF